VRRADLFDLLLLGLLWGASFLFIKEALADFNPVALVAIRLFLGAATLAAIVTLGRLSLAGWGTKWPALAALALSNAVVPFLLISFGEVYIDSGLAGVLNATTPLFAAPIARVWVGRREGLTPVKVLGIVIGFIGVAVLLRVGVSGLTHPVLLGGGAVLAASASYAFSSVFAHQHLQGTPALLGPVGQSGFGFLFLAPLAIWLRPDHWPGVLPLGSLLALGIVGTGVAYLLYFRLIRNVGPTRAVLVTYLLPCTAVLWGVFLLHERVGWNTVAGLALVLAGITLTLGVARRLPGVRIVAAVRRRQVR